MARTIAPTWADETLDRLAHKLIDGEIEDSVSSYAYGVARKVLLESLRVTADFRPIVPDQASLAIPDSRGLKDVLLTCLEECVAQLPAGQRKLILEYYKEDRVGKIENRKKLAERENVSLNVLRIRVFRIRAALEERVRDCAAARGFICVDNESKILDKI